MILEKREPLLTSVATALNPPQIPGYGPFRDDQAELLKSPWILGAPQPVFSAASRRISARISAVIFGRPPHGRERASALRKSDPVTLA